MKSETRPLIRLLLLLINEPQNSTDIRFYSLPVYFALGFMGSLMLHLHVQRRSATKRLETSDDMSDSNHW